jgi:MOSC domain-containing protein YiiM
MSARVDAVCVARAREVRDGDRIERTAIDKRPVPGPIPLGRSGLDGDERGDLEHHGHDDQAVYAYAAEDADHWAAELERAVPPGALGENLRTVGLDVSGACIGERWRVGTALVEVSAPRTPCRTFVRHWDLPDLVERFTRAGRPGAYLRVIEPGAVAAGDPVEVVARPEHGISVATALAWRNVAIERDEAERLAAVPGLSAPMRRWVERVLER